MIYLAYSIKSGSSMKRSRNIVGFAVTFLASLGLIVAFASVIMFLALWFAMFHI